MSDSARRTLAARVLDWMIQQQTAMQELLARFVEAESPSGDAPGQVQVLEILAEELRAAGLRSRRVVGGRHLYARRPSNPGSLHQVLLGHCDTVWPIGTLAERPFNAQAGKAVGPGVYDMKAGLVHIAFALKGLVALDQAPSVSPRVFINSDEEVGSPTSTPFVRELAAKADRVLVLEPSLGTDGRLKTGRKGVGRFVVTVKGRAAHAGLDPGAGVSAILELSHVVQRLFSLNDPAHGVSVNVGQIDGGLRANVIAPSSRAIVDVRVPTAEDAARVEAAVRALEPTTPGASLEIEGGFGRPPLERTPANQALWILARDLGQDLGLTLEQATAGGGSDGNTTSQFTATLDGLGAVGDGAHATHEHVLLSQMPERAALLALLILAPPLQGAA